jgi:hypothetical protein
MAKTKEAIAFGKATSIKRVMNQLRPNSYTDKSSIWNTVEKSLVKLTNKELSGLYALLLCKKQKGD